MFYVFLFLTAVVAIACLIAFTPGEGVEKVVRPINIAVIGAIMGGALALSATAIGFGGRIKPTFYAKVISAEDIIDGDTFWMGDVSMRLWGIDAPEFHHRPQKCRKQDMSGWLDCGSDARDALLKRLEGRLVSCGPPPVPKDADPETVRRFRNDVIRLKETFGRPIVSCSVHTDGETIDIAEELAKDGLVDMYRGDSKSDTSDDIKTAVEAAIQNRKGMWAGWTLTPDDWRGNRACRNNFESATWRPAAEDLTGPVVMCVDASPPPAQPANDNAPLPPSALPSPPPATPP